MDVTRVLDNHAIGRFFVIHGKSVCDETIKIGFIVKILKKKLLDLSSFLKNHMQSPYNFHNIFYNNILVSQKKKKKAAEVNVFENLKEIKRNLLPI